MLRLRGCVTERAARGTQVSWRKLFSAPIKLEMRGLCVVGQLRTVVTSTERLQMDLVALSAQMTAAVARAAQEAVAKVWPRRLAHENGAPPQSALVQVAAAGADADEDTEPLLPQDKTFSSKLITKAVDAVQVRAWRYAFRVHAHLTRRRW